MASSTLPVMPPSSTQVGAGACLVRRRGRSVMTWRARNRAMRLRQTGRWSGARMSGPPHRANDVLTVPIEQEALEAVDVRQAVARRCRAPDRRRAQRRGTPAGRRECAAPAAHASGGEFRGEFGDGVVAGAEDDEADAQAERPSHPRTMAMLLIRSGADAQAYRSRAECHMRPTVTSRRASAGRTFLVVHRDSPLRGGMCPTRFNHSIFWRSAYCRNRARRSSRRLAPSEPGGNDAAQDHLFAIDLVGLHDTGDVVGGQDVWWR